MIVVMAVLLGRRRALDGLTCWLQPQHCRVGGRYRSPRVDAETGVFMLLYLDLAYEKAAALRCSY